MNYFSKNLKLLRKARGLKQEELASPLGIKPNTISNYEHGVSFPDFDILEQLIKFYDISVDDILFKDLESILVNQNQNTKDEYPLKEKMNIHLNIHSKKNDRALMTGQLTGQLNKNDLPLKSKNWLPPKVITVTPQGIEAAVMIDIKAAAGLPFNIDNPQYFSDLPVIQLPPRQFSAGTYIYIQASGESMHPTIFHQDWVICRFEDDPVNSIKDGYIYLIVTNDGVIIKRCLNRLPGQGMLICQSDNSIGNPTFEVSGEDIQQVYKAIAKISFNLSNLNDSLYQRLNNIEFEVTELRKEIDLVIGRNDASQNNS